MNVLGIESSGPIGSAAACRDETVLAEEALTRGMEQGRLLVSLVDRVVAQAGWDKRRDVDLIAVSQGPGSFTGLRVGLAIAKTMAMLLGKPLAAVGSLDAMAENAPADARTILTAVDAKRGQVYAAVYERAGAALRRTLDPALLTFAQAREAVRVRSAECGVRSERTVYVLGDALKQYASEFPGPGFTLAPEELWRIKADVVARLGLAHFHVNRLAEPAGLEPVYLRLAEAEERRLARIAGQTRERSGA